MQQLAVESTAQARRLLGPRASRSRLVELSLAILRFKLGTLPMPSAAVH